LLKNFPQKYDIFISIDNIEQLFLQYKFDLIISGRQMNEAIAYYDGIMDTLQKIKERDE
jgi:hypothetical protein